MPVVKVYIGTDGESVIVDSDAGESKVISGKSFNFKKNDLSKEIILLDADSADWQLRAISSDISDSGGTGIGSYRTVVFYLSGLISEADDSSTESGQDEIISILEVIENLLTTIDFDTSNLDVALSTRATEATLLSVLSELQAINIDTNGLSQEATQLLVKSVLDSIKLDTANIVDIEALLTPAVRTHNTVSAVLPGFIPAGSMSGSVLNEGNQPGTWNGIVIPAGVSIPWGPIGNRDTYGSISYDPTTPGAGTTFIIEYTT
jgi:hypothetical protein